MYMSVITRFLATWRSCCYVIVSRTKSSPFITIHVHLGTLLEKMKWDSVRLILIRIHNIYVYSYIIMLWDPYYLYSALRLHNVPVSVIGTYLNCWHYTRRILVIILYHHHLLTSLCIVIAPLLERVVTVAVGTIPDTNSWKDIL